MISKTKESSKPSPMEWLEQYIANKTGNRFNINDIHYQAITFFSLIWNLFEKIIFNCECTEEAIWAEGQKEPYIDSNTIQNTYCFLRSRYIVNDSPNELFNKLGFTFITRRGTSADNKHLVDIVKYLCNASNIQEMNCVCLMLAKRFRNNLFHGNKDLAMIWNEDDELFVVICQFLISYLDSKSDE